MTRKRTPTPIPLQDASLDTVDFDENIVASNHPVLTTVSGYVASLPGGKAAARIKVALVPDGAHPFVEFGGVGFSENPATAVEIAVRGVLRSVDDWLTIASPPDGYASGPQPRRGGKHARILNLLRRSGDRRFVAPPLSLTEEETA